MNSTPPTSAPAPPAAIAADGRPVLFLPAMDPYVAPFMVAALRGAGHPARLLEDNRETLALGLKHTSGGECVPCPATVGGLLKAMRAQQLPPDQVTFFMPTACGPCRFGQYAALHALIFEKLGWGGITLISPAAENAYAGLGRETVERFWHAILIGDLLRKCVHKVRPYECRRGETDALIGRWRNRFETAFEQPDLSPLVRLLEQAAAEAAGVPRREERRPLVGVVGEIYLRLNAFLNGDVCRRIEELGGEAWLAPASEWVLYTRHLPLWAGANGRPLRAGWQRLRLSLENRLFFAKWEHRYYAAAEAVLHDRHEHPLDDVLRAGAVYVPPQFEGESILTLGRAALFVRQDGARAIVNVSPTFCMPGTITTGIFPRLERELHVPAICNFYDGSGDPNQALVPVMHYLRADRRG